MIQKILSRAIVRYALAGGSAYALELTAILTLYGGFGLSAEAATATGYWIGLGAGFLLQKWFAFQDYQKNLRAISKQLTGYGVLVGINYMFTLGIVALFPDDWLIVSRTLAIIATTTWNYLFYKFLFGGKTRPDLNVLRNTIRNMLTLKNKYFNVFLLCVPIIIFNLNLLLSSDKITPGDPDYYLQIYEAFRRSVLEFHQFPAWNPWVAGGIPLFANIQFGLVSIQAPFVLLFGAVTGMKIAIVAYQIIAFFGFKQLFQRAFKTEPLRAILLAYIPVFGSFFTYRTLAGHFTFLLIAFVPWLLLSYIKRNNKWSWLWFGVIYSFMVWSSPHYTTIMSAAVVGIWFSYETIGQLIPAIRHKQWGDFGRYFRQAGLFFLKAGAVIAALTAYRMYFVLTFIKDFPRPELASNEPFTGILRGLYAIWGPDQYSSPPHLPTGWGWAEAATYIGIGTLICLLLILYVCATKIIKRERSPFTYPLLLLGALFLTFFVLAMGDFGRFSPYHVLNKFPVFDSMRVATRWLLWCSLCALFVIAAYNGKRFRRVILVILALTVVELFVTGAKALSNSYSTQIQQYRSPSASFDQQFHYRLPRPLYAHDTTFQTNYFYDENLLETTRNNLGQIIAGDSLVDTRQPNTTIRCGANQGCRFISDNARIIDWTPNKIIIQRTAPGPIGLNMNPGKGWRVNGTYEFLDYKITDPLRPFIITSPAQTITLDYAPKYSPNWLAHKLHL